MKTNKEKELIAKVKSSYQEDLEFPEISIPYRTDRDILKLFANKGFMIGRMVAGSKSTYLEAYPNNNVIFNANIVIKSRGKIWYGDLDLTLDGESLQKIASELGESLYILREMDGRFENENKSFEFYKMKAIKIIEF